MATSPSKFPQSPARLGFVGKTSTYGQPIEYILAPVCVVSAGPFLMGSDSRREEFVYRHPQETPQHTVTLSTYEISRFPVTVAEYGCFVRAGHTEPFGWQRQLGNLDHPVVNVTWYDAVAYTAWLSERTRERWRLPTEAEWEKAARGTDGRIYPWGDTFDETRCNLYTSGKMGTTTPVGSYPGGASLYGVQDLAGNVWEWTSSRYMPYPYTTLSEREDVSSTERGLSYGAIEKRVLRGGAWIDDSWAARVAYRRDESATTLDNRFDVGFRLVPAAPNS